MLKFGVVPLAVPTKVNAPDQLWDPKDASHGNLV